MRPQQKRKAEQSAQKSTRAALIASGGAMTLIVLGLGQFINAYDSTSMNVALSNIVRDLHTTVSGVQSAISMYALVMAAFMITGSRLADIIGRKRTFIIGVITYGAGALITALSPNLPVMLFGWSLVEGIGACLMTPAIYVLIAANFEEGKARITAYAMVGAMVAVGAAMGPILCGLITTFLTWRVSFAMEVLIVAFIVSQSRRVKDAKLEGAKPKLDIVGVVLSALGMGTVVVGVLLAGRFGLLKARHDWKVGNTVIIHRGGVSPVIIFVGIGFFILAVFVLWEFWRQKRGRVPLIHLQLFKDRVFTIGLVNSMTSSFGEAGIFILVAIFLQVSLGYSALLTGLTLLPMMIAVIFMSRIAGRIQMKRSPRAIALSGFLFMYLGLVIAAFTMKSGASGWDFIPSMVVFGVGIGIIFPQYTNLVMSTAPSDEESDAAGLVRSLSNLGMSIGTALAGTVLLVGLIMSASAQVSKSTVLPPQVKDGVDKKLEGNVQAVSDVQLRQYLKGVSPDIADEIVRINSKARDKGMQISLLVIGLLSMIGFTASLWLPGRKKKNEPRPLSVKSASDDTRGHHET